jgi:hypothetical protein
MRPNNIEQFWLGGSDGLGYVVTRLCGYGYVFNGKSRVVYVCELLVDGFEIFEDPGIHVLESRLVGVEKARKLL